MRDIQLSSESEKKLMATMEGYLFVNLENYFFGNSYSFSLQYYTVIKGVVYAIREKELYPTGDTAFNIQLDCKKLGKYNPNKSYKRANKDFSYSEIKKALKL